MNALVPVTNAEVYRASTDAAGLCREIVLQTAQDIQQRRYVKVEGWQAIAVAHGCAAGARDVERVEGGVRAIGEVRRMSDGQVIATAEGFVGEDEPTWYGGMMKKWKWGQKRGEKVWYEEEMPKRPDYAIRAMAQTRAISRACRSAFAHVVVLIDAGLSTTPAEEADWGAPGEVIDQQTGEVTTVAKPPSKASLKRSGIYETLRDEMDACKTVDELEAWNKRRTPEIKALPEDWYDALADRFMACRTELDAPPVEAADEMDAEFRNVVGDAPRGVAGRDRDVAGSYAGVVPLDGSDSVAA